MPSFLHALYLLSIAHFVTAQSAAASSNPLAAESSYLASAQASDSAENSVLSAADASSYAAATSAASVAQSAASASEASGISAASVSEASEVSAAAAATSTYIDTAQSDLGILQLVTPTTHANQVAESAVCTMNPFHLPFPRLIFSITEHSTSSLTNWRLTPTPSTPPTPKWIRSTSNPLSSSR